MAQISIERVDNLPIILTWVLKMKVDTIIDTVWTPHGKWEGLSYGQLAVLFIAYVIQRRTHNLSKMEEWTNQHRHVIKQVTGWPVRKKEATDDRLGLLLGYLGSDDDKMYQMQRKLGKQNIQAYELPTEVARYDTTSVNVHHAKNGKNELLQFGYSKDKRPDLLQFKQGLGTIDPAGVPIYTETLSGETADDGLYIKAWEEMAETIGHRDFLFVSDSKGGNILTRATINHKNGSYLHPLAQIGKNPEWLAEHVQTEEKKAIFLPTVIDKAGNPKQQYGVGFNVERVMQETLPDGTEVEWKELWFGLQSESHKQRKQHQLKKNLKKSETSLLSLRPKPAETAAAFEQRASKLMARQRTTAYFSVTINTTISRRKKYLKAGRPTPNTPFEWIDETKLTLQVEREQEAIDHAMEMAGWRIFVTNRLKMTFVLVVTYYKESWQVEHGFHRFKKGSLPTLPLYIRLPERIKGLMLLLFIALQALTLLEFVACRSLSQEDGSISGLFPGNPKRKTKKPSAERMLALFEYLHLIIQKVGDSLYFHLNESLSSVQMKILKILQLPITIYQFS